MKIQSLHFILPLLLLSTMTNAQDYIPRTSIGLHLGFNSLSIKDEFNSPYTYKGNNIQVGMSFSKIKSKTQQQGELDYAFGPIQSAVSPEGKHQLVNIKYNYLFSINNIGQKKRFGVAAGPGIHALFSSANYLPDVDMPKQIISWGAYLTVGGNAYYRITDKLTLTVSADVPLVGYVYRPDFEVYGKTLSEVSYIGQGGLFNAKVELAYQVTPKVAIVAAYRYSYMTFPHPRALAIQQNGFQFSVRVRL